MLTGTSIACSPRNSWAEERRLRGGVLHLGAFLGWDARAVARFAVAITDSPWLSCGREDLLRVLFAYGVLAHQVRATQARLPGASGTGRSVA